MFKRPVPSYLEYLQLSIIFLVILLLEVQSAVAAGEMHVLLLSILWRVTQEMSTTATERIARDTIAHRGQFTGACGTSPASSVDWIDSSTPAGACRKLVCTKSFQQCWPNTTAKTELVGATS